MFGFLLVSSIKLLNRFYLFPNCITSITKYTLSNNPRNITFDYLIGKDENQITDMDKAVKINYLYCGNIYSIRLLNNSDDNVDNMFEYRYRILINSIKNLFKLLNNPETHVYYYTLKDGNYIDITSIVKQYINNHVYFYNTTNIINSIDTSMQYVANELESEYNITNLYTYRYYKYVNKFSLVYDLLANKTDVLYNKTFLEI